MIVDNMFLGSEIHEIPGIQQKSYVQNMFLNTSVQHKYLCSEPRGYGGDK